MSIPSHPLLWQETRDKAGNSRFEAVSMTYGDADKNPSFLWRIRCVLRRNEAIWTTDYTDEELFPNKLAPGETVPKEFGNLDTAQKWCQEHEDELRGVLGADMPSFTYPEPEAEPLIGDEHGFAATTRVLARWSPNHGRLRMMRVWKNPATGHEQEREIVEQPEKDVAMAGFFRQKMVEELVTRIVVGDIGAIRYEQPFCTVHMQAELDFTHVSAFTIFIREGGKAREIAVKTPTHDEIMAVVARQMAERRAALMASVVNTPVHELRAEIERNARLLGMKVDSAEPEALADHGGVLPTELGDIHRGGGDVTDPGQKNGGRP